MVEGCRNACCDFARAIHSLRGRRGSTFPISPGFTVSVVSSFRIMKLEFLKLSNFPKSQLKRDGSRMTKRTGVPLVYAF